MGKYGPLFVWTFVTGLFFTALYWIYVIGLVQSIWEADITHFTQIIAILALLGNFRIGYLAYKFGRYKNQGVFFDRKHHGYKKIRKHLDEWWFVSSLFMYIGIAGTSVGAFYLGKSFFSVFAKAHGGQFTPEQAFDLLAKVFPALGTVFSVTGAGVFATILIMVQLFLFTSISGIEDFKYDE